MNEDTGGEQPQCTKTKAWCNTLSCSNSKNAELSWTKHLARSHHLSHCSVLECACATLALLLLLIEVWMSLWGVHTWIQTMHHQQWAKPAAWQGLTATTSTSALCSSPMLTNMPTNTMPREHSPCAHCSRSCHSLQWLAMLAHWRDGSAAPSTTTLVLTINHWTDFDLRWKAVQLAFLPKEHRNSTRWATSAGQQCRNVGHLGHTWDSPAYPGEERVKALSLTALLCDNFPLFAAL